MGDLSDGGSILHPRCCWGNRKTLEQPEQRGRAVLTLEAPAPPQTLAWPGRGMRLPQFLGPGLRCWAGSPS